MIFKIERSPPHQLLARLAYSLQLSRIIESLSTRLTLPSTRQQEAGKVRSQSVPCETQTPELGVTGWGALHNGKIRGSRRKIVLVAEISGFVEILELYVSCSPKRNARNTRKYQK